MKTKFHLVIALASAATFGIFMQPVQAQTTEITITVKDKKFNPATITVPADKPFKLIVQNSDSAAMEIESHNPRFEKVIASGTKAVVNMKPLKAGTYEFYDDFNKSNKGKIISK